MSTRTLKEKKKIDEITFVNKPFKTTSVKATMRFATWRCLKIPWSECSWNDASETGMNNKTYEKRPKAPKKSLNYVMIHPAWFQSLETFKSSKSFVSSRKTTIQSSFQPSDWLIHDMFREYFSVSTEIIHKLRLQTWQNNACCKTLINDSTFHMPQHTSSEVTAG